MQATAVSLLFFKDAVSRNKFRYILHCTASDSADTALRNIKYTPHRTAAMGIATQKQRHIAWHLIRMDTVRKEGAFLMVF
jgi:hypothetical protein